MLATKRPAPSPASSSGVSRAPPTKKKRPKKSKKKRKKAPVMLTPPSIEPAVIMKFKLYTFFTFL